MLYCCCWCEVCVCVAAYLLLSLQLGFGLRQRALKCLRPQLSLTQRVCLQRKI